MIRPPVSGQLCVYAPKLKTTVDYETFLLKIDGGFFVPKQNNEIICGPRAGQGAGQITNTERSPSGRGGAGIG